jgi:hypothetical protein
MILETKTILRARYLTQMFPSNPPIGRWRKRTSSRCPGGAIPSACSR